MRTLRDVHAELVEPLAGDIDRMLSEFGLTRAEIRAVIDENLVLDFGPGDVDHAAVMIRDLPPLIERVYLGGVVTALTWDRERRRR